MQHLCMIDPHGLQRFVDAQGRVFEQVCAELRSGRKTSHWIWFIFPQIKGLGRSAMAEEFAIRSLQEAEAYLAHPVLGPRLRKCTELVTTLDGCSIRQILGSPDDLKFRSSMTLFARASHDEPVFVEAIRKYFAGEPDALTLGRLER
jgi:uncharacterized protein (DUF1810 family)